MLALSPPAPAFSVSDIRTVFLIVMENQDWSSIKGNPRCPYLNHTLLPQASYCEHYASPLSLHPTLPNYLWLVAGTNFGIRDNSPPNVRVQDTTNHLAFLLDQAGISWKHYQVGLAGLSYPPTNIVYPYHTAFNPFLYFRNVLTNVDYGRAHIRPYEELASDLTNGILARFNLISPGLWHSMHDSGPAGGDAWLAGEVPKIMASAAYQGDGAVFIMWDEDDFGLPQSNIGMIVLSPLAKGGGYQSVAPYTHSSTLRTLQNIFGVRPYLGDAAKATDLGDLFKPLRLTSLGHRSDGGFILRAEAVMSNRTHYVEASADLSLTNWTAISTNVPTTTNFKVFDPGARQTPRRFYRVREGP
ncbi:MAG: phosphoesterase [Verrucomicrobia bacterium]|nr:phosphoesterase [Verrucomicrobiota bacterium]